MAIPTQFSVTSTRSSPIANPSAPQDAPQLLDAENVSIVDGANVLASLSSGVISAPSEATAQPVATVDTAVTIPAEAQVSIDAPVEATALNAATIDNASALPAETAATIATPTAATAESIPTADTPSVLTAKTGTLTTPPFPLNHARILWRNLLVLNEGFSATNGNPTVLNALKPNTWEKWAFTGQSVLTIQFTFNRQIDCFCIGAHNLGTLLRGVDLDYSTTTSGDDFVNFQPTVFPTNDNPIMIYNESAPTVRRLRLTITGGNDAVIGYLSAGIALQMQRPFFNGHTPITDGDVTDYYSNRTESGEIIGQQIRRKGFETSAEWQNIDDTWYREYFAPFKQAAKLRPFFFAWNLLEYPDDVGFCRIAQDISAPMQNGTVTKRSISMNLLGAG